jgi:uncharacterized protein YqgV (UPF0045/DUF77 family)
MRRTKADMQREIDALKKRVDERNKLVEENRELTAKLFEHTRTIVEMEQEHRKELNTWLRAGMLLMREVMLAKIRKYGPDLTNAGMPRVGVKALAKYVDKGLLHLNPESLQIFSDRVVELLEAEALKTGYGGQGELLEFTADIEKEVIQHISEEMAQEIDKKVLSDIKVSLPKRKR